MADAWSQFSAVSGCTLRQFGNDDVRCLSSRKIRSMSFRVPLLISSTATQSGLRPSVGCRSGFCTQSWNYVARPLDTQRFGDQDGIRQRYPHHLQLNTGFHRTLSSDHGENLGENRYGITYLDHSNNTKQCLFVPWLELPYEQRKTIVSEESIGFESPEQKKIKISCHD